MPDPLHVLITGGSGGIGYELAVRFARDGHALILVARDIGRLESAASRLREEFRVSVTAIPADLALPEAAAALAAVLDRAHITIDVLVNNAGVGMRGPFAELDPEAQMRMLQLNVGTLTQLSRLLLPPMLERGRGRILNVASTAAFQPGPLMAVYYASKAYVLSFSEGLAEELSGTGVTVTALCPGLTRTDWQARSGIAETWLAKSPGVMDASSVADAGYRALMRGSPLVIPGFSNRVVASLVRWLPRRPVAAMVRQAHRRRG